MLEIIAGWDRERLFPTPTIRTRRVRRTYGAVVARFGSFQPASESGKCTHRDPAEVLAQLAGKRIHRGEAIEHSLG
ncbi:hypothetical protein [Nocardia australiensis]|uniref:hypothetical protein n=1 Tax=Nocardia australiensis TaxID=2887191 RepID=UPI001D15967F|nr:hypothetical protein [Nocardia australiensis]